MPATDIELNRRAWAQALREKFEANRHAGNAAHMSAYMKGQFAFFGIKTPLRKELVRQTIQELGLPPVEALPDLFFHCFEQEEREFQYVVQDLGRRWLKKMPIAFLAHFEHLIARKSWWDTVDFLAPKLAGGLLKPHPQRLAETAGKWIESENFWYQRAAILLQLDYKEQTHAELLFRCIQRRIGSSEFFVQKASGWALRQYSKVAPQDVARFIDQQPLPPLVAREGMKWLNKRP